MQIFLKFFFIFFLACPPLCGQGRQVVSPEVHLKLSSRSRQPAEMLRLAYLREQKENYAQALFYLNLYALTTHDTDAMPVIEQLASRYRLLGYEHNDFEWLQMKYRQYFRYILLGVLALWASVLLYWLYAWSRGYEVLLRYKVIWGVTLVVWGLIFNFYQDNKLGIIATDQVYVMDAPSAGGRTIKVVNQGHRIPILEEVDIWYKIRWQGKPAYIRKNFVWELTL
jgi:hypothetical protein